MGSKRKHSDETEEERQERKRQKKEAKKKARDGETKGEDENGKKLLSPSLSVAVVVETKSKPNDTNDNYNNMSAPPPVSASTRRRSRTEKADDSSPIVFKRNVKMCISLLPGNLKDIRGSIERKIRSLFFKYSSSLGGILIAFENLQISDSSPGRILQELPHIHYNLECTVLILRPSIGAEMDAEVAESFHSHLSVIVLGFCNASIAAHHLEECQFEFDDSDETWYFQDQPLEKGRPVRFNIERVHESGGIISIEGYNPRVNPV